MSAQISGLKPVEQERKTEPFFYKDKLYELTRLYDGGRLWKAILAADGRSGHAEEGLKIAVRNEVITRDSKGIEIEYRV